MPPSITLGIGLSGVRRVFQWHRNGAGPGGSTEIHISEPGR